MLAAIFGTLLYLASGVIYMLYTSKRDKEPIDNLGVVIFFAILWPIVWYVRNVERWQR